VGGDQRATVLVHAHLLEGLDGFGVVLGLGIENAEFLEPIGALLLFFLG